MKDIVKRLLKDYKSWFLASVINTMAAIIWFAIEYLNNGNIKDSLGDNIILSVSFIATACIIHIFLKTR